MEFWLGASFSRTDHFAELARAADRLGYHAVTSGGDDDPKKPVRRGSYRAMADAELALVGTPDDVKRGLSRMLDRMPDLEWFGLFMQGQQGVAPLDHVLRTLEMFAEKVIPEFQD